MAATTDGTVPGLLKERRTSVTLASPHDVETVQLNLIGVMPDILTPGEIKLDAVESCHSNINGPFQAPVLGGEHTQAVTLTYSDDE